MRLAVTELVKTASGVERITNLHQGTKGREMETDSELYQRYHLGTFTQFDAISAKIEFNGILPCIIPVF